MGATFDSTGTYRYRLWRKWDWKDGPVTFVMLNPSTADAEQDDPTIRRCIAYAKAWGFGGLEVVNLFAYRSTSPLALRAAADPVGPDNDAHICDVISRPKAIVVAAWGTPAGWLPKREESVIQLLRAHGDVYNLGLTAGGYPKHPLYLKADLEPSLWRGQWRNAK